MVYADGQQPASVSELARTGNLQAISYWLNARLAKYRLFARVDQVRSGNLRIVIELRPNAKRNANTPAFRNKLVRYVCHQLWQLNSPNIDGAMVAARYVGQSKLIWKQSVRIVSPARRIHLANSPQSVQRRVRQVSRKRKQFQAMRSVLISGSSVAAFVFGCWLGYADAPSEQTQASAVMAQFNRSETKVQAALETLSVNRPKELSQGDDVKLMFAGDVSFSPTYDATVGNNNKWSLGRMDELREADISMVNLDTPLTNTNQVLPGKKANIKASPNRVDVLSSGGVDLVNLANNSTMDYQSAGLSETINTLNQVGIATVGAGQNATAARRPVIMDVKGQRVAYLSYYDSDLHAATDANAGTNPRRNDRIAADIKSIRDQVNWVVVNYHWGESMAKYPGDWQIDLARFTVDQGADLVVGHHAKVLQGAEIYKGRPIAYSLGNFIFSGQTPEQTASDYDTAVLKVGLKDQKMRVEFLPVEVRNFQARVVKDARGQQILERIKDVSDIFDEPLTGPMILDAASNTATPLPTAEIPEQPAPPPVEPIQPSTELFKPSHDRPWNQNTFTVPSGESGQQGSAITEETAPQQLELPIQQNLPPSVPTQFDDSLESPKRRYAKAVIKPAPVALKQSATQ
ncbi:CapA family protein [filamentous cyanobacterium LEGE 11480]|uniref:CapA family protein n=1 Tax=Romeriopsis navalis LEGE 11480 TaxID=2777977 RepID=A0A928Z5L5_9CYAN|nr:CapA family protein [Romeriopsis navalis]MBE9031400.1 CapA family protein [Romeriopsis navalis LEGE 11480]